MGRPMMPNPMNARDDMSGILLRRPAIRERVGERVLFRITVSNPCLQRHGLETRDTKCEFTFSPALSLITGRRSQRARAASVLLGEQLRDQLFEVLSRLDRAADAFLVDQEHR